MHAFEAPQYVITAPDPDHDAECESEFIEGPNAYSPCDCIGRAYRKLVAAFGGGFHPDTPAENYVGLPEGYTAEQVDAILAQADADGIDVYSVAAEVAGRLAGAR